VHEIWFYRNISLLHAFGHSTRLLYFCMTRVFVCKRSWNMLVIRTVLYLSIYVRWNRCIILFLIINSLHFVGMNVLIIWNGMYRWVIIFVNCRLVLYMNIEWTFQFILNCGFSIPLCVRIMVYFIGLSLHNNVVQCLYYATNNWAQLLVA